MGYWKVSIAEALWKERSLLLTRRQMKVWEDLAGVYVCHTVFTITVKRVYSLVP